MEATSSQYPDLLRLQRRHNVQVRRHLLRNYIAHGLEGGLYIGGMRFVAAETVAPAMVASLGGPDWLTAAMPMIMVFGFVMPQLLMAHRIQAMNRHMPFVATIGAFQRLPLLVAGLVLLLADHYRTLALAAVALAPLSSGLIAGLGVNGWQELVAKTIPAARRSSLFASRNVLAAVIGLAAGVGVERVLSWRSGPIGFGVLHLIAFGFMAVSFAIFLRVREIPYPIPPRRRVPTLAQNLRRMPGLIRGNAPFRNYLLVIMSMAGIFIMMPFLGIHALEVLDKPTQYLGILLLMHTTGSIIGNVLGGTLGDRFGGKLPVALSQAGFLVICAWGTVADQSFEFLAMFFLLGASQMCMNVGRQTIALEVCPVNGRASYLAILGSANIPSMTAAWLISYVTWHTTHSFAWVAALTAVCVVASAFFLHRMPEPRKNQGQDMAFPVETDEEPEPRPA